MAFDPMITTKRILKKLGGDKIPGKVLTFDGDLTGKEALNSEMVKISDEVIQLEAVQSLTAILLDGIITYTKDQMQIAMEGGIDILAADELVLVAIVPSDIAQDDGGIVHKGTYVFGVEVGGVTYYVSKIVISETIHPIDPKYLPGVCLPVVELSTIPNDPNDNESTGLLTAEEAAQFEALGGAPCILKFSTDGHLRITAFAQAMGVDGIVLYAVTIKIPGASNAVCYAVANEDGRWLFTIY